MSVDSDELIERQETGSYAGVRLAKALLALGYEKRELQWTAIRVGSQAVRPGERTDPSHAGVHGLLGALAKENPSWRVRLADVDMLSDKVIAEAERLPGNPVGATWAHRDGRWYEQRLAPLEADAVSSDALPYRRGGVYVVIGGAGGLGAVWTEHVVRRYDAQAIWIGRRPEARAGAASRRDSSPASSHPRTESSRLRCGQLSMIESAPTDDEPRPGARPPA